jgi:hypothetical protein
LTTLAKAKAKTNETFIVQVSLTIITYDRKKMFIVQATGSLDVSSTISMSKSNLSGSCQFRQLAALLTRKETLNLLDGCQQVKTTRLLHLLSLKVHLHQRILNAQNAILLNYTLFTL